MLSLLQWLRGIFMWPWLTTIETIPIYKVNDALRVACSMDEWNTVLALLNVGAQPTADNGAALMSAVLSDNLKIVNTLLLVSKAFDDENTVHLLNRAINIANRPSATTDPNIVLSLQSQIDFIARKNK